MGNLKVYTPWIISSADFVSKQSGNWNDPSTWRMRGLDGILYDCLYTPERGNNIYIESTHTVTCTQNEECNNVNYINGEDKVSINTGVFNLNIYGILRRYTGSAPGTDSATGSGIGTAQWLTGNFTFKGVSRTLIATSYASSFNLFGSNFTIDLDSGQVLTIGATASSAYTLGGNLTIKNGNTLNIGDSQLRVSETLTTLNNSDGVITVESGGRLVTTRVTIGPAIDRTSTTGISQLNINAGAILEIAGAQTNRIMSAAYNMLGALYFTSSGAQIFPLGSNVIPPGNIIISNYSDIYLNNAGTKSLVNNINISGKLSIGGTASLSLNGFTVTYGSTADLEITETRSSGSELPNSGSGSAIPYNLRVAAGKIYTAIGVKNIRGTIILGAGASVIGTVNQNQS